MEASIVRRMDPISRETLRALVDRSAGPCVSAFLPIEWAAPARQQNIIRLENLLRRAETLLIARGAAADAAHAFLADAYALLTNHTFWLGQADGLALFVADGMFHILRLPIPFEELVVVDERPYIVPLLPLLHDERFFLLAIGLGGARLFAGTRYELRQIPLPDVPASLGEALAADEFSRESQVRSGASGAAGSGVFYGHGARDGTAIKQETLRYFQQVERGVRSELHDADALLILAGLAHLLPIYRAVNHYPWLADAAITGNPDDLPAVELHRQALAIMAQHATQQQSEALARFAALHGATPARATNHLRALVPAATNGRVDILLIAAGARRWGRFDPPGGGLTIHEAAEPRDAELVNLAAIEALQHGGDVLIVEPAQMPEDAPAAAIFRY
jgi:hypothetical protein